MSMRARTLNLCTGAFCFLTVVPALAQMEVQISPKPVNPNATPDSPLNPRKSLLHPQPVRPDPVRPNMQVPATPHPEALRPGPRTYPPGFTMTREKPARRGEGWQGRVSPGVLERPAQISDALLACWRPPALAVRQEITVRLGFGRDGRPIGEPRITYIGGAQDGAHRETLRNSLLKAISDCTPLRFTPTLASAIAGRPFAIRFIAPAHKPSGKSI
jgi:hypothetical protein